MFDRSANVCVYLFKTTDVLVFIGQTTMLDDGSGVTKEQGRNIENLPLIQGVKYFDPTQL